MKTSPIELLDQESIKQYSKDELLSLAKAGLKQAKQRQYRLQKAGYELGDYINTFNRRMSNKRLENDTLGQLRDDVHYIWNYLKSENTSVSGRIQKGKNVLNHLLDGADKIVFSPRDRIYKYNGEIISEGQLKEFFKYARKLESASIWDSWDKSTDYSVLETVFTNYFSEKKKSFKDMVETVNAQVKNIRGREELPDSFSSTDEDEEED